MRFNPTTARRIGICAAALAALAPGACGLSADGGGDDESAPRDPRSGARGTVFEDQVEALERADDVEEQLQEATRARLKELE